jgi:hypothetical protein
LKKLVAALVLVVLAYVASPYAAVALVARAVTHEDEDALASRIDFDSVRASLTEQLQARIAPGEAPNPMLPTLLSSFVTPRGVAMLLRRGAEPGGPPGVAAPPSAPTLEDVEWFFFTRPTRFEVQSRMGSLILEPRGVWWRVVDVKLPAVLPGMVVETPRLEPPPVSDAPELEVPDFGAPSGS